MGPTLKLYKSIDELPIWNFEKINKTSDLGYLYSEYQEKPKIDNLDDVWEAIYNEFIKEFGLSQYFLDWLNLRLQALELYREAYVEGEKYKRVLAKVKEAEADELMSSNSTQDNNVYAIVSKSMGFRVDPKQVSVKEFYQYLKLAQK